MSDTKLIQLICVCYYLYQKTFYMKWFYNFLCIYVHQYMYIFHPKKGYFTQKQEQTLSLDRIMTEKSFS